MDQQRGAQQGPSRPRYAPDLILSLVSDERSICSHTRMQMWFKSTRLGGGDSWQPQTSNSSLEEV